MDRKAQLEWERRWSVPVGVTAFVAAALPVASLLIRAPAFSDRPPGNRGVLIALDENPGAIVASAVIQSLATALTAVVLFYLLRAARGRREIPKGFEYLVIATPVVAAIGLIWSQLGLIDVAEGFAGSGDTTESRADRLLEDRQVTGDMFALAGNFLSALSFVLVALNAMRVGLLSRFLGYLGVIIGALIVLPLVPGGASLLQLFWLPAVALVILGRGPIQRGPAWVTGEAAPWPSAAEMAAQRQAAREQERMPEPSEDEAPATESKPSRKRKKRKKR
jgi:hypothetical protein